MGSTRLQRAARERQKQTGEKYVIALRAVKEEDARKKAEQAAVMAGEEAQSPAESEDAG